MKNHSDLEFDEMHHWQAAPGEREPTSDDRNTQSTDDDDEFDDGDDDDDEDEDEDKETEQEDAGA